MHVEDLLDRLQAVRRSGRGYIARCPAHDDRSPSLSIREGERGLLVKCWTGCTLNEITSALSIKVRDLFYDADRSGQRLRQPVRLRPMNHAWRKVAGEFNDRALDLRLRAERILEAAVGLNPSGWNDQDLDVAMRAVGQAYANIEWADVLGDVAYLIRARGLASERARERKAA